MKREFYAIGYQKRAKMKPTTYSLENRKRLLHYPYALLGTGWMPNHRIEHRNNCLQDTFFCISFQKERMILTMLPHGTVLNSPLGPLHDELFFVYSPETAERIFAVLGTSVRFAREVFPGKREQGLIQEIRQNLNSLTEPGAVDRLDRLAFSLICELFTQSEYSSGERVNLLIHESAIALEQGENLAAVIRNFGFSRRNFYREWSKVFSVTPVQFLLERRLAHAEELLLNTRMSVKQISAECRFSSPSYFCSMFLKYKGVSPLTRREQCFRLNSCS